MTSRAPPGRSQRGSANVSQKWWQVMQPLERNASSVGWRRAGDADDDRPRRPASMPAMSVATVAAPGRRLGERRRPDRRGDGPAGRGERVPADAQVVEGAQDLGVAAQQSRPRGGRETRARPPRSPPGPSSRPRVPNPIPRSRHVTTAECRVSGPSRPPGTSARACSRSARRSARVSMPTESRTAPGRPRAASPRPTRGSSAPGAR